MIHDCSKHCKLFRRQARELKFAYEYVRCERKANVIFEEGMVVVVAIYVRRDRLDTLSN